MIDAQMIQLKERIDAAIQLIRSLKEENKSLKDDLFSTHSQMNRLQTEVSQLKAIIRDNDSKRFDSSRNNDKFYSEEIAFSHFSNETLPQPEYDPFFESIDDFEEVDIPSEEEREQITQSVQQKISADNVGILNEETDAISSQSKIEPSPTTTSSHPSSLEEADYSRMDIFY